MRYGIFLAPFHKPGINPTLALQQDIELVQWLDRCDYDEVWFGEHHSAGSEISADPFLMAVAVGASCAFLTPIGHQNNTLILGPGGFRFGDYWRLGLPLEALVVAVSMPLLLWAWPL